MGFRAALAERGEVELPKRRTLYGKTFLRPDGKVRVVTKVGPQHYPDNGQMVEIDDEPETDGVEWSARRAPYLLRWNPQTVSLTYASRRGGGMRIRLLALDGVPFTAPVSAPERQGQNIRVLVHPALEIELRIRAGGVEIFKRLFGPTAPKTLRWEVIEDDMTYVRFDPTRVLAHDNMAGIEDDMTYVRFDPTRVLAHDNMAGLVDRPGDMLPRRRAEVIVTKGAPVVLADGRTRYVVTEQVTGRTRRVDDATGARSWMNELAYPVFIDVTVTEDIAANDDDGTSNATNFYTANYCYTTSTGSRRSVWRWQTVDVPQGQTLDSATFSCNITANASSGAGTVKGENVDNASAWTVGGAGSPATMSATTAGASWAPSGTGIKSVDVTSVVQEIINRAGWVANNAIRLGMTTVFSGGTVTFEDFNAAGTDEGQLVIIYTAGAAGQPTMRRFGGVPGMGQGQSFGRSW